MSKVYQIVTDQIIKQLEQVDLGNYKQPWFCVGNSPVNLRGTAYRGINHLLLAQAGHKSNVWATYNQWKEHECQVRKGQKSRLVVLWKFFGQGKQEEGDEGEETTGGHTSVMVRYYCVFNSEQVEGQHARTIEQRMRERLLNHNPIAAAQDFVNGYTASESMTVRTSDRAYYHPAGTLSPEHIGMPELGQFLSPEHYYGVFAHEITHSTGAKNRLDRDMSGRFGNSEYAFEELIAELGSAMICGSLGLEQQPRPDHAQYIKSWLRALKSDNRFIISAASKAQKAADYALEAAAKPVVCAEMALAA